MGGLVGWGRGGGGGAWGWATELDLGLGFKADQWSGAWCVPRSGQA